MTNEIIQAIREEIARLQPNAPKPGNMKSVDAKVAMQVHARLNKLLSFLSDLEKSLPSKSRDARRTEEAYQEVAKEMREQIKDGEELEKEISQFIQMEYSVGYDEVLYNDNNECLNTSDFENIARHFYDLGCRRTAEKKYDEIEYNRQRDEGRVLPGFEDDPEGIPGKDFVPVEWVETLERYGKWKIVKLEEDGSSEIPNDLYKAASEYVKTLHDIEGCEVGMCTKINLDGFKFGDKVRVIIVKED